MQKTIRWISKNALLLGLIQAIISTLGSLYFSDVLGFTPCFLCWWQRIFTYPLVIIFMVAILRKDSKAWQYALPLVSIGWLFSLYQNLLYYHILPWWNEPCRQGASCTTKYISWFGFVSIPLLAFVSFSVTIVLCLMSRAYQKENLI